MIKICRFYFITVIFVFCFQITSAQYTYKPNWKKEKQHILGGFCGLGIGLYMQYTTEPITTNEIDQLSTENIPNYDKIAFKYLSKNYHYFSHITLGVSMTVPLVLYGIQVSDREWLDESIMYAELMIYNAAIVTIIKYSFSRPRPYLYQTNGLNVYDLEASSTASFYSGHTSLASASSFYSMRLFNRMYPDSPLKPYVFTSALVLPAVVGYSRIRAGKHFPSDVIIGYVVGAGSVYLQEILHKNDRIEIGSTKHGVGLVVWLDK